MSVGNGTGRSVEVNAVPQRIVAFLCDVNLRLSLDSTQQGKPKPQLLISIVCGLPASQAGELEVHRRVIRTRLSARVAHLICETGMAFLTGVVCVALRVRHGHEKRAVAVNIDVV